MFNCKLISGLSLAAFYGESRKMNAEKEQKHRTQLLLSVTVVNDVADALNCCSCDISVYGGLKRLQQWNEAYIDVVSSTDTDGDISPTFRAWSNSLCVSVANVDSAVRTLPLWHGGIMVYGSEVNISHFCYT